MLIFLLKSLQTFLTILLQILVGSRFFFLNLYTNHYKIIYLLIIVYYKSTMQSTLSKKINTFKVSIRKQQIQAYKKQKRRHLFQDQQTECIQGEDMNTSTEEMYANLFEATTFQNFQSTSSQCLNNNIQMLIEIVGGRSGHLFKNRYQNLVCSLVDFFQYSYSLQHGRAKDELNQNHVIEQQNKILGEQINQTSIGQRQRVTFEVNLKQNYMQQKERRIKAVAFDRLLSIIQPNNYLKLIALIYYEISPKNLTYIDKTIIIVRQILSYLTIDRSVITYYLSQFGIQKSQLNARHINKSTALLIILNITYNQDEQILKLVYDNNILHSLADWIESLGCFQMYDKEVVAAIYANCIDYLCQRSKNEELSAQSSQIKDQANSKQNLLLLNLFQSLLATENTNIYDKLVFIAVNLLKTSISQDLPCLNYLIQLCYNLTLNIIQSKQYFEQSQELFIVLSELYDSNCSSNMLLDFLDIILTKYTVVYYKDRNIEKNRGVGVNQNSSKLKGLQNISKLIQTCQNLLTNPKFTLQAQQAFFRYITQFWCKEELFGIRSEMFNFVSTAFSVSNELSDLILNQYSDFIAQLANQSCERIDQMNAQLNLLDVFLGILENKCTQDQYKIIQQNSHIFEEIRVRLEDYVVRSDRIEEVKYKITQGCLERIEKILSNTGML